MSVNIPYMDPVGLGDIFWVEEVEHHDPQKSILLFFTKMNTI